MLSLQSPQVRFVVRGTGGTFVKHGVDVQESQLVSGGTYGPGGQPQEGVPKPGDATFGVEGEELEGTLYKSDGETKVKTLQGSYLSQFPFPHSFSTHAHESLKTDPNLSHLPHTGWFKNVHDAISKGDPELLVVKPEQAALTIRIIEAAQIASKEGRTVKL